MRAAGAKLSELTGDIHLLCTDGLAEQVSHARLTAVRRGTYDPGRAVATLLTDSLTAGGDDNATAVVIRVRTGETAHG